MDGGGEAANLKYTPTWVVAAVCIVIVAISLFVGGLLDFVGEELKERDKKCLLKALKKVKEELMMLGFISLLLTVFQNAISDICIPKDLARHMLPCKLQEDRAESTDNATTSHISSCAQKNKVPLLSVEALHHLHIFIFVLGIVHVTFCVLTISLSWIRSCQWRHWEKKIAKQNGDASQFPKSKEVHHSHGCGKNSALWGWPSSFVKLIWGSVTRSEYMTLRKAFIETHVRENREKFKFHSYLMHVLEDEFKEVVGIRWYLWIFAGIFLLLNVHGWLTSFWMSFIPLILLLAVGTKLEHVITKLAHEVAQKHNTKEGDLVLDKHFRFVQPQFVLFLIHFILFENTFEIAFFFWIWIQYRFKSCIMGGVRFVIVRLIIGAFIQVYYSWRILPLFVIVTQVGTSRGEEKFKDFQDRIKVRDTKVKRKGSRMVSFFRKAFWRLKKKPSKGNSVTSENHPDANHSEGNRDVEASLPRTRPEEASLAEDVDTNNKAIKEQSTTMEIKVEGSK